MGIKKTRVSFLINFSLSILYIETLNIIYMVLKDALDEVQEVVDKWICEHGGYWPPLSMICAVMEELGEVAKEVNSIEGYKPKKSKIAVPNLGEELADLLFSIICIANHYKIDLGKQFSNIINKYSTRDSIRFS